MHHARYMLRAHKERRDLLPEILSDVLPSKDPQIPQTTLSLPLGAVTSLILPSLPLTSAVSQSSSDSITPSPSSSSSASLSTSTSSLTTQSSPQGSPSPTSTPTLTSAAQSASSVYETTSAGKVQTITSVLDVTSSASPSHSATVSSSFLHNKALSGTIFALVGLVFLAILLAIATFAIRRKRNQDLLKEAISFNPSSTIDSAHHYGAEKGRLSPGSSEDHYHHIPQGGTGQTFGANVAQVPAAGNIQQSSYPQLPERAVTPDGNDWHLKPVPALPNFVIVNQSTGTVDEFDYARNGNLKVTN